MTESDSAMTRFSLASAVDPVMTRFSLASLDSCTPVVLSSLVSILPATPSTLRIDLLTPNDSLDSTQLQTLQDALLHS